MEDIKVVEEPEKQLIWIETDKRKNRIKIYVPQYSVYGHWRVAYEDGRPIEEIPGSFLSRREAILHVKNWLRITKQSKQAKQYQLFGDKEPPVLRAKKVKASARTSTTDNS